MIRPDVAIVGAGPAGCATAIHLARLGRSVVLLDRATFPRSKPCAEYLTPETLRCLETLGVRATVEQRGFRLEGTSVHGPRGSTLTGRFAAIRAQSPDAHGLAIERTHLDLILLEAARGLGVPVLEGTRVTDVQPQEGNGKVELRCRDGVGGTRALSARVVVGADGIRSIVSRRMGTAYHSPLLRRIAFVGHLSGIRGLGRITQMHVGPAGYVGLNPLGADRANAAVVVPVGRAAEGTGDKEGFFLRELRSYDAVRPLVAAARFDTPVVVTGPFASRARRVVADGVLLVGDAADFFDPFTGEGVCTALRGAGLAADALHSALACDGPVSARRLRPYAQARRRAFRGKWMVERLIGFGMLTPALFDRAVHRLARRGLADTFLGVTGDMLPARTVLNPLFLSRMLL